MAHQVSLGHIILRSDQYCLSTNFAPFCVCCADTLGEHCVISGFKKWYLHAVWKDKLADILFSLDPSVGADLRPSVCHKTQCNNHQFYDVSMAWCGILKTAFFFATKFSMWPPGGHLWKHTMGHISWTLIAWNTKFWVLVHLTTVLNIRPRFWIYFSRSQRSNFKKFDVGWIRVQDSRLVAILFQNPKSPISAYVSWTVIARITIVCRWMHLTTLDLLFKVTEVKPEGLKFGVDVEMYWDQYLSQVRCLLKSAIPWPTGSHSVSESKIF
jgi:hypothetical protein